jgi:hypothetical protein
LKKLLYLHGFNSSPQSEKAQLTSAFFAQRASASIEIVVPALPPEPRTAMTKIKAMINQGKNDVVGLIGSSLGGFYSLHLHAQFGLPAVLINPAIRPYELLQTYIGENINPYTDERYEVAPQHMEQLLALKVAADDINDQNLFLLTQTGDEVLDFRQACELMPTAKLWLDYGGGHAFQNFAKALPSICQFFDQIKRI